MARSIHQSGFLLNWQCLGFKQIKYQLMWNLITETWDFSFMKTENWNSFMPSMCIQIPWTMLFLFGDRTFFSPYTCLPISSQTHKAHLGFLLLPRTPLLTHPRAQQLCWLLLALFFTSYSLLVWEYVKCCSHTLQFAFVFLPVPLLWKAEA